MKHENTIDDNTKNPLEGDTKPELITINPIAGDPMTLTLTSPLAIHAVKELNMYRKQVVDNDPEGENSIDAAWINDMLKALPAMLEIMSRNQLLSNVIVSALTLEKLQLLAKGGPLSALTSCEKNPDEWMDVSDIMEETCFQSKRCPSVFYYAKRKEYIDVDTSYFVRDYDDETFSGKLMTNEAQKIFGPWINGASYTWEIFKKLRNVLNGSGAAKVEMPYLPPKERTSYRIDWLSEIMAIGMNQVASTTLDGAQLHQPATLADIPCFCKTVHYGIYHLDMDTRHSIWVWMTFEGSAITAPQVFGTRCCVAELPVNLDNISKEKMSAIYEKAGKMMEQLANYAVSDMSVIGAHPAGVILIPRDIPEGEERWWVSSRMIEHSVPAYNTLMFKITQNCFNVCGLRDHTGTYRHDVTHVYSYVEQDKLFALVPRLKPLVKKRYEEYTSHRKRRDTETVEADPTK